MSRSVAVAVLCASCGCAISTARMAPTASGSTSDVGASSASANATDVLIGAKSRDWLLDPPAEFSAWGERILASAPESGLGVVVGRAPGGEVVLAVDLRHEVESGAPGAAVFEIMAVHRFSLDVTDAQVAWDRCTLDGAAADRVVALLAASTSPCGDDPTTVAVNAWRIEVSPPRFIAIDANAVRCRRASCEDDEMNTLTGGIPLDSATE